MCGIFAYLNYCTPRKRDEILTILIQSLQKLAFKSYDSAGTYNHLSRSHWSVSVELKKTPRLLQVTLIDIYLFCRADCRLCAWRIWPGPDLSACGRHLWVGGETWRFHVRWRGGVRESRWPCSHPLGHPWTTQHRKRSSYAIK